MVAVVYYVVDWQLFFRSLKMLIHQLVFLLMMIFRTFKFKSIQSQPMKYAKRLSLIYVTRFERVSRLLFLTNICLKTTKEAH